MNTDSIENRFEIFCKIEKDEGWLLRKKIELLMQGENSELIEMLQTDYVDRLINSGFTTKGQLDFGNFSIEIATKSVMEVLLGKLEKVLLSKGIKLASNNLTEKFYTSNVLQKFSDAAFIEPVAMNIFHVSKYELKNYELTQTCSHENLAYMHGIVQYVCTTIELVENDYFKKPSDHVCGCMKEQYRNNSYHYIAGLDKDDNFFVDVDIPQIGFFFKENARLLISGKNNK